MKIQIYQYLLCAAVVLLAACSGAKKEEAADEGVATVLPDEKNEVTVLPLKRQIFNHELVSNGKIVAGGMADLRFESSGIVAQIYVKNGDRVHKGQKLAELDKFRLKNKTAQSKDALEKAKLELQDVLIGQGYAADDTANVPDDIMQLARVKSGYDQTLSQYELAKYEEEHATLIAPFDGVVANLFSKPYNAPSSSDAFCTIRLKYSVRFLIPKVWRPNLLYWRVNSPLLKVAIKWLLPLMQILLPNTKDVSPKSIRWWTIKAW